jgi:hypothetical protein
MHLHPSLFLPPPPCAMHAVSTPTLQVSAPGSLCQKYTVQRALARVCNTQAQAATWPRRHASHGGCQPRPPQPLALDPLCPSPTITCPDLLAFCHRDPAGSVRASEGQAPLKLPSEVLSEKWPWRFALVLAFSKTIQ